MEMERTVSFPWSMPEGERFYHGFAFEGKNVLIENQ